MKAKHRERSGKTRKAVATAAEVAPRRVWIVVALAAAGAVVAAYLTWTKLSSGTALFCEEGGGCDIVQASPYALMLGVPTALWGLLLYAAIAVLAAVGLTVQRWQIAFMLAAAGVGFSLYLTYISLAVIGAACSYCLASAAIVATILAVLIWRRPPLTGRHSPVRPSRLAALGGLAAVGAVVVGAGIFAWNPAISAAHQLAVAHHLRQVDAVMYGAYW